MDPSRTLRIGALCTLLIPTPAIAESTRPTSSSRTTRAENVTTVVDAYLQRPIDEQCNYTVGVVGGYESRGPARNSEPVRNVDLQGTSVLRCSGRVVDRKQDRVRLERATPDQLAELFSHRLALQVPGSACIFVPRFDAEKGQIEAESVATNCSRSEVLSSLRPYRTAVIGGGPQHER